MPILLLILVVERPLYGVATDWSVRIEAHHAKNQTHFLMGFEVPIIKTCNVSPLYPYKKWRKCSAAGFTYRD